MIFLVDRFGTRVPSPTRLRGHSAVEGCGVDRVHPRVLDLDFKSKNEEGVLWLPRPSWVDNLLGFERSGCRR